MKKRLLWEMLNAAVIIVYNVWTAFWNAPDKE